ncbi:hypothetical protein FHW58_003203 [Duganella sp. 1224]|uniref:hypothetical protein n=1 Tax=Duganella sp. 1224 TaxID=2587052 RepID=UPI0015CC3007|nr:hypothetical protein [Duganella sp. 1224]NYE61996.1 hypothetical protein [Duganella sp. 1224]
MAKFYKMTLSLLNSEIAVNENSIVAVMRTDEADSYRVWLSNELSITDDIAKRVAKLGAVTPISQDWWDVKSSDLKTLL